MTLCGLVAGRAEYRTANIAPILQATPPLSSTHAYFLAMATLFAALVFAALLLPSKSV